MSPFVLGTCALVIVLYVALARSVTRYEPASFGVLLFGVAWGGVVGAFPSLRTSAAASLADPESANAWLRIASIALVEEAAKGAFLVLVWVLSAALLRAIERPIDGAVVGGAVGLGYALAFVAIGGSALAAGLAAGLAHVSFTAGTGVGVGLARARRGAVVKLFAPIVGLAIAIAANVLHRSIGESALGFRDAILVSFIFGFVLLVSFLALSDRSIVVASLSDEVGKTIHAGELGAMTSVVGLVPGANALRLLASPGGFRAARRKQVLLAKLAFIKHRERTARGSVNLREEWLLRERIADLTNRGVFVGSRPR